MLYAFQPSLFMKRRILDRHPPSMGAKALPQGGQRHTGELGVLLVKLMGSFRLHMSLHSYELRYRQKSRMPSP